MHTTLESGTVYVRQQLATTQIHVSFTTSEPLHLALLGSSHYTPDLSRQAIPLVLNGVLSEGSDLLLMVVAAALGTIAVHIGEA